MPTVFISYRRSDSQMVAGRLRESLLRRLGDASVFRDKNSIGAGEDWMRAIDEGLSAQVVVLALLGSTWASVRDEQGRRRLDDPADWNRVELERALERRARVIPLLVDGAAMPALADLPESLQPLARLNALKLRDDDWDADLERLVQAIGAGAGARHRLTLLAAGAALAVMLTGLAAWWWLVREARPPGQAVVTAPTEASSYRDELVAALRDEQSAAFAELGRDRAKAIALIDRNLTRIAEARRSFPSDVELRVLAGYAAKNAYASSKDLLPTARRQGYLNLAADSFEAALALQPGNAGAVNGLGNVAFYRGRFDTAIELHRKALALTGGNYPAARHDLELVQRYQRGELKFDL